MLRGVHALLCLVCLVLPAKAEGDLEIISLKHRTVEEVIPGLRPLLEPDGVLTGMHGQLILRASPVNRAQIRQALAALDTPLRQLRITVRQSLESQAEKREAEIYGSVGAGNVSVAVPPSGSGGARAEVEAGKVRIGARLEDRDMNQFSRVSQEIRVVDGGQAFIRAGTSLPLTQRDVIWGPYGRTVRESTVYRDVDSGFYVKPQVIGERVSLEINPVQQTLSAASPYVVVGQELRTNLTGRLGEWISLGGGDESTEQENRQLLGKGMRSQTQANQVWIKVEVID
jgi:type II secretory pathway component GspD/PulD (secretin)